MQPAALSPRLKQEHPALSSAASSVQHVITVDSAFLLSQPSLAPFANTTLPPPLLASLPPSSLRVYSRFHVKAVLALMGVKPRHIHRIVAHAFSQLAQLLLPSTAAASSTAFVVPLLAGETAFSHASTVCLSSAGWLSLVRSSLTLSKHYTPSDTPTLFAICHSIVSRQQHVLILLAGTSGTGKSTLASLLADRMRLSSVIGTDSVRHILRQRVTAEACRVLHVSTYQAHQCIADDTDLSLLSTPYSQPPMGQPPLAPANTVRSSSPSLSSLSSASLSSTSTQLSQAQKVKLGHYQQSLHVCAHLYSLIASLIASRTSAIIEGVHLLPAFLSYLIATLSSSRTLVLPFLIYISNETKHRERFALRSHPAAVNPYILHFPAIRTIQKHMIATADTIDAQHWLPTIDNTNMDRSVAAVHEIVSKVMVREGRQAADSDSMEWSGEGRADVLREVDEMRAGAWSSKAMQRVIRMKVEKRHLFDRLREAEWKRREEEGGKEAEDEDDDAKDGASPSLWTEPTSHHTESSFDLLATNQHTSILSRSPTLPPSTDSTSSLVPVPTIVAQHPASPPTPSSPFILLSASTSPRLAAFIPTHSSLTASSPLRSRPSPLSPSFSPSPQLSPHLSALPPPFLHHHHQRIVRAPSSDEDEYEGHKLGGGRGVSESEHSVSVTYSHDVPSLLAPSADEDGEGDGEGDGEVEEVDGSDAERAADDRPSRGSIVAIPESDNDHAAVDEGPDADHADSDSASDGCYERGVTDDDERQLAVSRVASDQGRACSIAGGLVVDVDGLVDSSDVKSKDRDSSGTRSSGSSSSSAARREIVLY